jgi:hypothetical protein
MIASRNDNYQGVPVLRLEASLKALLVALDQFGLTSSTEILVVDWSSEQPLVDSEPIKRLRKISTTCTRWIYLAGDLLDMPDDRLSEVHALNAAARRAKGDILLRLDQDTILSPTFFEWFVKYHYLFHGDAYTLLGRRDSGPGARDAIMEHPWEYVSNSTNMRNTPHWHGEYDFVNGIGAVGVIIFTKSMWFKIQGYNEKMTGWGHMEIDLWKLAKLVTPALEPVGLQDRWPALHIYHERLGKKAMNTIDNFAVDNPLFGLKDIYLPETHTGPCYEPERDTG